MPRTRSMCHEVPAIGIDLGTTFSCVAVVRDGKIEIIPNDLGNYTTPSCVAFNEHERLIGDGAKEQRAANSANTVFDVKRLIGRKFDDPIVQEDMKQWPFKVVEVNGMPKIEVTYKNEVKRFSAEEISAMVLGKMKEIAETYLNAKVTNAVVTVPAYFNDMQRKATKDAATIAGLNVTRIINEPTAAAIAYGLKNGTKTAKNVMVYDFGGGTFDVSILKIHKNVFEVKATSGNSHLGGEDFDNRMMEVFAEEFKRKNEIDIAGNKKALRKLRTACERAKRALSVATQTFIEIDTLAAGVDLVENISRARFEDMCSDLFESTIATVEGALEDAGMKHEDIDTIILVGGSTRIPKIRQLLEELFEGKEISKTINADEAVAHGAAIQAAIIHGGASKEMKNMKLLEVTPLSLGVSARNPEVSTEGHIMAPVIKRNTPIPISAASAYRTSVDDQTSLCFRIIQGERLLAKDNSEIGELTIDGIPMAPAGVEKASVAFSIDDNGILTVMAVSLSNREARAELTIKNVCGSLTTAEIEQMVADAKKYRKQDEEVKEYHAARRNLELYCIGIKNTHRLDENLVKKCNEVLSWLNDCRPKISEFPQRKDELESLTLPPKAKKSKRSDVERDVESDVYDDPEKTITN